MNERMFVLNLCMFIAVSIAGILWAPLHAEPSSPVAVKVVAVRPYANSYNVYLEVSSGQLCSTSIFIIMTHEPGGKEMYAAALAALTTGKRVILEVSNSTGCTGWGTKLQSIYLLAS